MLETSAKEVHDNILLGGKGTQLGLVQEIKIWPYCQMVYAQNNTYHREWKL